MKGQNEVREGAQCRQTQIPATHGVLTFLLQVVEKAENRFRRKVRQVYLGGGLPTGLFRVSQEEPKGVAISGNGFGLTFFC